MPQTRLTATVVNDPSRGFTRLPREPLRHLLVLVDRHDDGFRIGLFGGSVPRHSAVVRQSRENLESVADKLRQAWEERLVRFRERDEDGYPVGGFLFAENVDLDGHAPGRLRAALGRLQRLGWQLLLCLTDGTGKLGDALLGALGGEGLRISFESRVLQLPWAMMCLRPEPAKPAFDLFLGYRHQIEQTGCLDVPHDPPPPLRPGGTGAPPKASLNADASLAPEAALAVGELLGAATALTTRRSGDQLLAALSEDGYDEELMYFWCHGFFEASPNGTSRPRLAIRLHRDEDPIDSAEIRAALHASPAGRLTRSPFVLLNACNTGRPSDGDVHHLGQALVEKGAGGVLAPQIEVPVPFAARYAARFLELYLAGESAGVVVHRLAREFADDHRNPLGLVYALHYGMDCRLGGRAEEPGRSSSPPRDLPPPLPRSRRRPYDPEESVP